MNVALCLLLIVYFPIVASVRFINMFCHIYPQNEYILQTVYGKFSGNRNFVCSKAFNFVENVRISKVLLVKTIFSYFRQKLTKIRYALCKRKKIVPLYTNFRLEITLKIRTSKDNTCGRKRVVCTSQASPNPPLWVRNIFDEI